MKVIVGLGNPGKEYQITRHNAGFLILDNYISNQNLTWENNKKFDAQICTINDTIFVKPQVFMNNSGTTVSKVLSYLNTPVTQLLIIHDDADLEFGKVKKQFGASAAGHHGVSDIIEKLGTQEFWRLRIGVGRPQQNTFEIQDWVLKQFSNEELDFIRNINVPLDF